MSKEVFAIKQELRINEEITAKVVKLIDDTGAQLGEMPIAQALNVAEEKNLEDIIEKKGFITMSEPTCGAGRYDIRFC